MQLPPSPPLVQQINFDEDTIMAEGRLIERRHPLIKELSCPVQLLRRGQAVIVNLHPTGKKIPGQHPHVSPALKDRIL